MGMDGVELVMEVEEAFDIRIPDEVAGEMRTVGDLYHYVVSALDLRESELCLSSAAFYQFRRTVMERLGVTRSEVRVTTRLETLLARSDRRAAWEHLGAWLGWRLPPLRRPTWMGFALAACVHASFVGLMAACIITRPLPEVFWMLLLFVAVTDLLLAVVAFRLTQPFATEIPLGCVTVRAFVESALQRNYGVIGRQAARLHRREVFEALRRLVSEQLGAPLESIDEDSRFVEDLGMD